MNDENEAKALAERFYAVAVASEGTDYMTAWDAAQHAAREALRWREETRPVQVPPSAVPEGMVERIGAALKRIHDGHCIRRIPADPTDADLVLGEVLAFLQGKPEPFWTPGGKIAAAERNKEGG